MFKKTLFLLFTLNLYYAADINLPDNFPGGYIGLSAQFGTDLTVGVQGSFGVAVPGLGEPSTGDYLFPGFAIGKRYSFKTKKPHTYIDGQITYLGYAGVWVGVGAGLVFMDGEQYKKYKYYGGWLVGGGVSESLIGEKKPFFRALHAGIAIPIIGTMFYP
ncbi:MAG: hypothetical protein ISR83_00180 [Candidatus Marinimicrobia bacterium]|nr:hypothetical protein [Candidatus Neomarinimicrobiota bacterium]